MTNRKHKGQLSPKTIEALAEADRALHKAYELLEYAAQDVTQDVAGVDFAEGDFNDEAMYASRAHPMYKHVWKMLGHMEDDGWLLQEYLKLEQK